MSTTGGTNLRMYFSDRRLSIDAPPPQGTFGRTPRQPFSANATEALGATLSAGFGQPLLRIEIFGNSLRFPLAPMGNLLVGTGPQFGQSPEAVWVLAFIGIIKAPG